MHHAWLWLVVSCVSGFPWARVFETGAVCWFSLFSFREENFFWLFLYDQPPPYEWWLGMKTVWIFFNCIWDQIRLEGFRSVRIRVRIFNIRYRIRIRILKSYIYNIDIQSYHIRHSWHYPYSNLNPN